MNEMIAGSIGGLVGALAAAWLYAAEARKQRKADTLRRFVANRFDLAGVEFSRALNEAIVVFADNRSVIRALDAFRVTRTDANLIALYRTMSKASGLSHRGVTDDLFFTVFNAAPSSTISRPSVPALPDKEL